MKGEARVVCCPTQTEEDGCGSSLFIGHGAAWGWPPANARMKVRCNGVHHQTTMGLRIAVVVDVRHGGWPARMDGGDLEDSRRDGRNPARMAGFMFCRRWWLSWNWRGVVMKVVVRHCNMEEKGGLFRAVSARCNGVHRSGLMERKGVRWWYCLPASKVAEVGECCRRT
jgi:hypothetical protein